MASNVIRATLLADASRMKAGFKDGEQAVSSFETKATKSVSGVANAAKAFLAIGAVQAIASFAGDSIMAFSDLEQATGAVESVFGEAADKIISTSEEAADKYGLSAAEMQQSSALLGSQLKNQLGLDVDAAADKTLDLIGVASDLAAQFGGSTSDAVSALSSLMRGERDPIEKYGVSLNEAMIEAKALEMGLVDAGGQVTDQGKKVAALELVYEQTADAAGAFGRESETVAGKLQRSKAKFTDLKAEIGKGLAPAFGLVMDAISALQPVFESLTSAMEGASGAVQPLIDELTTLLGIAPGVGLGLEDVGAALAHGIVPFLGPITMGLHNINSFFSQFNDETESRTLPSMGAIERGLQEERDAIAETSGAEQRALDLTKAVTENRIQLSKDAVAAAEAESLEIADAYRYLQQEARQSFQAQAEEVEEFLTGFEAAPERIDITLEEWFAQFLENLAEMEQWKTDMKTLADAGYTAFTDEMIRQGPSARGIVAEAVTLHETDPEAMSLINSSIAVGEASMLAIGTGMAGKAPSVASSSLGAIERALNGATIHPNINVNPNFNYRGKEMRASGGPVTEGRPYVVGEQGEEVFIPERNGTIVPHNKVKRGGGHAGAGGGETTVNIHVQSLDPQGAAKAVVEAIEIYKRNNGGRLPF